MRYDVIAVRDDTGVRGYAVRDTFHDHHIALCDDSNYASIIAACLSAQDEMCRAAELYNAGVRDSEHQH